MGPYYFNNLLQACWRAFNQGKCWKFQHVMYLRKETQIKGVLQAPGLGLARPSLSLLFSVVTGAAPLRAPAGASTYSSSILPAEGGAAHSTLKLQVFAVKRNPLVLFFFFFFF